MPLGGNADVDPRAGLIGESVYLGSGLMTERGAGTGP
jgi:hypothetical protein